MRYIKCLVWFITVFIVYGKGNCTVFLQSTATVNLPCDFPVGATFFRLQPIDEITGKPMDGGLIYHVLKSVAFPAESKSGRGLFTVDEHTGSLMLSPHRRHALSEYKGSTFALDIVAMSSLRPTDNTTHATIVITISKDNFSNPNCHPREHLCFSASEIQLQIPETVPLGTTLESLRPITHQKLCPELDIHYSMSSDALLSVSEVDGYIKTTGLLDYEKNTTLEYNVSCYISNGNASKSYHTVLQVFVLDVDDNAPYIQDNAKLFQELDVTQVIPGKPLPTQLTVLDADSAAMNNITVNLNDPLDLFNMRDPVVFHGVNGTHMLINTALVPKIPFYFPRHSYGVLVTFTDNSLISSEEKEIQFHIRILNHSASDMPNVLPEEDFGVVANVFRHSSRHARIVQPMEVKPHEGYFFRLLGEPDGGLLGPRIFGVTPETGIVYVKDEAALARSSKDFYELQLTWRNREELDRKCSIKLKVLDAGDPTTVCGIEPGHHFPTCALHATSESCTSSCGRGALDGFCRWRAHVSPPSLTSHYATCTPNLATCPDGVCDELEEIDPMLCPQDCAANVRGEAVQGASGKGVGLSAAPCTCASPNTCVCIRIYPRSQRVRRPASRNRRKERSEEPRTVPAPPLEFQDEWSECGTGCAAMIAVVSLVVTGLIVSATLLVFKRRGRNAKGHDFPSVTTPLNPTVTCRPDITSEEDRLEFPRSRLSLEETLGEGEFGRVVKGRAWDIASLPGVSTVAVKMLKDGSSPSEKRDLVTELNLLKDLSHPNVVRLLGACTDEEGPLYVIMEFAEHGSLITFLRKMRARYPHVQGEIRELISYAWQIAKGMEYLAENKVVHRDLAARNVLVATGKIMKISDFGLSRDVYEKDAYLKTTKGRVPVKWMAMESLQNHLYTTKSDVWSFGILLWEIITLGGCPYPGIPAENLYRLLKEGYRMPRPDDCPIQMYQLMTICWREKPHERPHFKDLVRKLEFLLNDSMHYLPMRDEERHPPAKRISPTEETSLMTQLTFPKMSTVAIGPYENRRLLSPTEYSV